MISSNEIIHIYIQELLLGRFRTFSDWTTQIQKLPLSEKYLDEVSGRRCCGIHGVYEQIQKRPLIFAVRGFGSKLKLWARSKISRVSDSDGCGSLNARAQTTCAKVYGVVSARAMSLSLSEGRNWYRELVEDVR